MLDCLILGDSLALGVGQARPGCTTVAKTGITSGSFIQTLLPSAPRGSRRVVISLGVNDDPSMNTIDNLRQMRRSVAGAQVTWLLPGLKPEIRRAIGSVARENGDRLVDTQSEAGPDHLHPGSGGYRTIAAWTEQGGGSPASTTIAAIASARPVGAQWLATGYAPVQGGPLPTVQRPSPHPGAAPQLIAMNPGFRTYPAARPTSGTASAAGSVYGNWPPSATPYAAIPPRDYAYRAFAPAPPR